MLQEEFNSYLKSKGVNHNSWIETLTLTAKEGIDQILNIDDDIRRELVFYNLSLLNAKDGINKLIVNKAKINRPDDFFAEMLKDDRTMEKIKKKR